MGSIVPIGRIVRGVIGSTGSAHTASQPVVTQPVAASPGAAAPTMPNNTGAAVNDPVAAASSNSLSNRDLGIGGTIFTSLRGLLNLNNFSPSRKSLLGE